MKTIVVGDLHGNFYQLVTLLKKSTGIKQILQVGDFGYWKHLSNNIQKLDKYLNKNDIMLHWCEGNHEEHPFIKRNDMVTPNIIYQPRGSIITLSDGRIVLFIGGADSIDKGYRIAGYDWFPDDENIAMKDIDDLPDIDVDVIISHTAPEYFELGLRTIGTFAEIDLSTYRDSNREALNIVYDKYKPKEWYFGHFHKYGYGKYKDCEWMMLSRIGDIDSWYCEL